MNRRYLYVVDDFYADASAARQKALALNYQAPLNPELAGLRTHAFRPRGVKARIERVLRVRIGTWDTATDSANGAFFSALSRGRNAERVCVHYDTPVNWMTMLIYLTPGAPLEAGTSFWQHKETGLRACPTQRDVERLGVPLPRLAAMLEKDSPCATCWQEIDRVGNVFNRAVAFPAGVFHSATRHFGSTIRKGRIFHSFHFGVV